MGKLLLTVAVLVLVASDDAIADGQLPAFATPAQSQTNPSDEPSQSLMLACSGLLTTTDPVGKSAVSDVSVILYSNSANVFSSLFDVGLPVTRLEGNDLFFETRWENDGIKYRIAGAIDINGRGAVFNEVFVLNDVVKISFWYLHCKEGAVPPPVDLTPPRLPLIIQQPPRAPAPITSETPPPPPPPADRPAQISMNAADWTLKHSPRLDRIGPDWLRRHGSNWIWQWNLYRPSSQNTRLSHPLPDPQGGWSVSLDSLFPRSKPSNPSYLITTSASPILTQGQYLKMVGEISARSDVEPPILLGFPAWCRMYLREVEDDPSYTKTDHENYRWWSIDGQLLQGGRFVLLVGLEPQFWMNVAWQRGDESAATTAGFQRALANPQTIGILCSGNYVAADGDNGYLRALVDATFSVYSFAVCDPLADARDAKQDEACAPPSAQEH